MKFKIYYTTIDPGFSIQEHEYEVEAEDEKQAIEKHKTEYGSYPEGIDGNDIDWCEGCSGPIFEDDDSGVDEDGNRFCWGCCNT